MLWTIQSTTIEYYGHVGSLHTLTDEPRQTNVQSRWVRMASSEMAEVLLAEWVDHRHFEDRCAMKFILFQLLMIVVSKKTVGWRL